MPRGTIIAAGLFLLASSTMPAFAQRSWVDLYNQTISVRQSYGPSSPQYAEIVNRYNARCAASQASPARRGGSECEELRLACENKAQLGERGEGNCQRYRQVCQQPSRQQVCAELRAACLHKDQLGEQGAGNCQRYRETCRR
jgi:hypothetical protein